jgi:NAD(P)-dependent dehydrogenase (short-subunit alcohol dehydrogenase family)
MKKTVLITGASSGIGKATAKRFQKNGWNVIATMRSPEKETELTSLENTICPELDVTKTETITQAIAQGIERFGKIDVLVNNAGYAVVGAFELAKKEQIKNQFDTNVMGLMAATQAILPHFRKNNAGVIINVSSMGGRFAIPLYSLYHATKWAVEGFTESLQFELEPFNINVKLIEPGAIKTDFYERSANEIAAEDTDYETFVKRTMPQMKQAGENGSEPEKVADVIYRAATDRGGKLRYIVGKDAKFLLFLRSILPYKLFRAIEKSVLIK